MLDLFESVLSKFYELEELFKKYINLRHFAAGIFELKPPPLLNFAHTVELCYNGLSYNVSVVKMYRDDCPV